MKYYYVLLILFFDLAAFTQNNTQTNDTTGSIATHITFYEQYNSITGGDSVRYFKGKLCIGWFKDFYPNGKIKHKGLYEKGKLKMYKNYYDNGQLERFFRPKDMKKSVLDVYYKNGQRHSKVIYFGKSPMKWEDYYKNGQLEYIEEYNKGLDFYLYYKFYYEDGKPQFIFELQNKKKRVYYYIEYFANGQIKENGQKQYNELTGDYPKIGTWKFYNKDGTPCREERYYKGILQEEKEYE